MRVVDATPATKVDWVEGVRGTLVISDGARGESVMRHWTACRLMIRTSLSGVMEDPGYLYLALG